MKSFDVKSSNEVFGMGNAALLFQKENNQ